MCANDAACTAFNLLPFPNNSSASCCLYSAFSGSTDTVPGWLFYSLPQCEICAAGYFKHGRRCEPASVPPLVEGGAQTLRTVMIPLTTGADTELLTIVAMAEDGFAPLTFTLEDGSANDVLAINSTSGVLTLVQPLTQPGLLSATIIIRDNRDNCTRLDGHNVPHTLPGPCETQVNVAVDPVVFFNCPDTIVAYLSLDANNTNVTWVEPTLPSYLDHLIVSRNLGDITAPADVPPPFQYTAGTRTVTYTTEPLSIGGSMTCSFDVVVELGFAVDVLSVARQADTYLVQEFLVVELGASNDGSRLPPLSGTVADSDVLVIEVRSPSSDPFVVAPKVCGKMSEGTVLF